ncbi:AfsR/SARP family transcriptional regulator [Streptomyces sp. NPDC093595]|uniref:AfsR/SARP family transcriptional regulator n=1 Tax=Streptomyces sp. NPDC093595 TaxID=3366045 RepID=UPI00380AA1FC
MRVGLLGTVELDAGAGPLAVGGTRLRALLARLALDAGRAVRPGALVEDLWGDTPPADPANALQSLVSRLRGVLADPAQLALGPAGYRLAVEPEAVDTVRFAGLAQSGHDLLARSRPAEAATVLREALGLWRGPALVDVRAAPFAEREAERLTRARLAALGDRIEADLARGAAGPGLVAELQSLTAEHPLHERLHAQLILSLEADGRNAEALAVFADLRRRLADTFGSDPGPEVAAAHLRVLRGRPPARPGAPRSRAVRPRTGAAPSDGAEAPGPESRDPRTTGPATSPVSVGNLDTPVTSFVGRVHDVRRVTELLDRARLVTLVGPGGAGKTRLAQVCGRELAPPGGVWCVALAPVGAGGVARAVLDVLRARGGPAYTRVPAARTGSAARPASPAHPVSAARPASPAHPGSAADELLGCLTETLAGGEPVLLLDNCEHVVEEAARLVAALLTRCPGLRVLATSREPLRLDGEHLHVVGPLEVPAPGSPPGDARACAAIRLFEDRAAAVAPGFAVDGGTVAAVAEICRRLDGLPLAIELAAACLRGLPLAAVAARLDDRFRLLTRGSRAALPRHRTLRAVVAWSWELLEPRERTLLERLTAVPGGFTEDAAAAVGGLDGEVTDLLAALVDKSLLHLAGTADPAEPRYAMAETIRAYGRERLAAGEGPGPSRDRHAAFHLRLAETAEPLLRTREQTGALARFAAERDHLTAALRWSVDSGDAATAVRLAAALGWFWTLRGNPPESVDLLGRVLEVPGACDQVAYARVVAAHALGVQATGLPRETEAAFARFGRVDGAAEVSASDPHPLPALARLALTVAAPAPSSAAAAAPAPAPVGALREVSRAASGDTAWDRAFRLLTTGLLSLHTGDVARAEERLERAVTGFEEVGEDWGLATALSTLGALVRLSGDLRRVRAMTERADACFARLGMREYTIENEVQSALLRASTGDLTAARRDLEALLDQVPPTGAAEPRAQVCLGLARLEWRARRWERARLHAEAGLAGTGPGRRPPAHLVALLLCVLAAIEAARGCPERAVERLGHPAVRQLLGWDTPVAARIAVAAAGVALARGDAEAAARLLGAATALRGAEDLSDEDARDLTGRATRTLGTEGFTAAYAAGRALSREGARALVSASLTVPGAARERSEVRPDGARAPGGVGPDVLGAQRPQPS